MSETVRSRHGGAVFVKGCIKAAMAALFVILFYLWIHGFTVTDQADYVAWHLSLPYRCAAVFLAAVFAFSLFALIRRALGLLRGRQLHILTVVLLAGMVSLQ
ncbi:MAG: hypothetical protein J6P60_06275, partial [Lachnospiraceae bacterium]|nr:hypothetical protein [Lachnospiraceae bacterium]